MNNGDKIQPTTIYNVSKLKYNAYYKDFFLTTFIINYNNFPLLENLIFGDYVQNGVKGQELEISECQFLKTIQFGVRSFTYYQQYVFKGKYIYLV